MRFLLVDRIVQSTESSIYGLKHVTSDDPFLQLDEQGRWFFVPSLVGEALGQLAAWHVMAANNFTLRPVAGVVACARLFRQAFVGETIQLESMIDSLDEQAVQYHSVARVGVEKIFEIEGALGPLLPMNLFIDEDDVRCQYQNLNRPGNWASLIEHFSTLDAPPQRFEEPRYIAPRMRFDVIVHQEPQVQCVAEKKVNFAAGYFADHFPKKPVLPMTVLLACQLDLVREFLRSSQWPECYQVRELRRIKMNDFVHPGDVVQCQLQVKQRDAHELILGLRCTVDGRRVCVLDVALSV